MEPYMGIAFFLSTKSGSATVWVGRKNFTNFGSNPSLLETSYQLLHPPSPPKNNKNMSSHWNAYKFLLFVTFRDFTHITATMRNVPSKSQQ